ncbi:MAG TPA: glyoxalase superfamily protein [Devosia sp.]|nr:glyoxalase superfamily protein [Devosia sp.]
MPLTHLQTIPILRSFDEAKAREFYLDFLGFKVDWEHRFEPGTPLYMQVSRDGMVFHISEHHGDSTPGSHVRINCKGVRELHAELIAKKYKNNRPGLEHPDWGGIEVTVVDPCRNLITFAEDEPA